MAARNLAATLQTVIRGSRHLLPTMAQFPPVPRRDRDACNAMFAEIMGDCPYYAVIAGVDSEGMVFASAPRAISISNLPFFQETKRTLDFVVGEPVLDRISRKYNIMLSFPILDDAAQFQGLLWVGLDLEWLGGLLAKCDLAPRSALALVDYAGKVLFRYPEPLRYTGKTLPPAIIKVMAASDEGVAEGTGLPGDARLFAFARLSQPWQNMLLAIGLPRATALAPVNRELWLNLAWLGLVGLLTMTAAWYGSGLFIVQPVRKLHRHGPGHRAAHYPAPPWPGLGRRQTRRRGQVLFQPAQSGVGSRIDSPPRHKDNKSHKE